MQTPRDLFGFRPDGGRKPCRFLPVGAFTLKSGSRHEHSEYPESIRLRIRPEKVA